MNNFIEWRIVKGFTLVRKKTEFLNKSPKTIDIIPVFFREALILRGCILNYFVRGTRCNNSWKVVIAHLPSNIRSKSGLERVKSPFEKHILSKKLLDNFS